MSEGQIAFAFAVFCYTLVLRGWFALPLMVSGLRQAKKNSSARVLSCLIMTPSPQVLRNLPDDALSPLVLPRILSLAPWSLPSTGSKKGLEFSPSDRICNLHANEQKCS